MNFCSGGVQEGTVSSEPAVIVPPVSGPPRPPGIPEHYIFDEKEELWMPPSAIGKAGQAPQRALSSNPELQIITSTDTSTLTTWSGTTANGLHEGKPGDPICFEYINGGVCNRLARGEVCRYRHLVKTHPDVVADRVRNGKLPPAALDAAQRGDHITLKHLMQQAGLATQTVASGAAAAAVTAPPGAPPRPAGMQQLLPGQPEADLPDPGPTVSLCFEYINAHQCTRLRTGQFCKYRHLPPTHPDVIADRVRNGKYTKEQAQALLASGHNPAIAAAAAAAAALAGSAGITGDPSSAAASSSSSAAATAAVPPLPPLSAAAPIKAPPGWEQGIAAMAAGNLSGGALPPTPALAAAESALLSGGGQGGGPGRA